MRQEALVLLLIALSMEIITLMMLGNAAMANSLQSEKTFASVVQATALQVIDYCDLVYGSAAQCVLSKLQKSQNFAARIVTGV